MKYLFFLLAVGIMIAASCEADQDLNQEPTYTIYLKDGVMVRNVSESELENYDMVASPCRERPEDYCPPPADCDRYPDLCADQ